VDWPAVVRACSRSAIVWARVGCAVVHACVGCLPSSVLVCAYVHPPSRPLVCVRLPPLCVSTLL
jgi:hypothetical protein